jgi:hypothetical protein
MCVNSWLLVFLSFCHLFLAFPRAIHNHTSTLCYSTSTCLVTVYDLPFLPETWEAYFLPLMYPLVVDQAEETRLPSLPLPTSLYPPPLPHSRTAVAFRRLYPTTTTTTNNTKTLSPIAEIVNDRVHIIYVIPPEKGLFLFYFLSCSITLLVSYLSSSSLRLCSKKGYMATQRIRDWTSKFDNNCLCKCYTIPQRECEMYRAFKFDSCLSKCYMATQIVWDEKHRTSSLMIVYVNVKWYHHKIYDICIEPASLMIVYVNVTWCHKIYETICIKPSSFLR